MKRHDRDTDNNDTASNDTASNDTADDVLNLIKSADPAGDPSSLLMPTRARTALFEEITMTNTAQPVRPQAEVGAAEPTRQPRLPRFLVPAAMAVAAVAVIAGVTVSGPATATAQEAVAQAAQALGSVTSGKVDVTVTDADFTSRANYVFSDGAFDASFGGDDMAWGEGAGQIIRIDDSDFTSIGFLNEPGEFIQSAVGEVIDDVDYESVLSLNGEDALDQARLLPVIEAADDLEEVSSDDGSTTFEGSVPAEVIEDLDRSELPAGFAAIVTSSDYEPGLTPPEYGPAGHVKPADLGDTVSFNVTVSDDAISSVTLEIPGYTLTVDYLELGQPQDVSAPSNTITVDEAQQRMAELEG